MDIEKVIRRPVDQKTRRVRIPPKKFISLIISPLPPKGGTILVSLIAALLSPKYEIK
jgi:hypothetical protein